MKHTAKICRSVRWISMVFVLTALFVLPMISLAETGDRQIESGPGSFTVRGGGTNNTSALGIDGRIDYLHELLNLHLFGTVDIMDGANGEGGVDNKRYGAGVAFSHTFARQANLYAGTSFIREMNENFGQAYVGAKVKVTDYALLSASYGFGFGNVKVIEKLTNLTAAEAVDWLKAGAVLVSGQGLKANLYYYLTDPGDQNVSGIEGELSYPVLDKLTIGINGSCDLNDKTGLERNWRSFLFATYAFGGQKASPIDVALDKNNPVEYPRVLRTTAATAISNGGPAIASTLAITPAVAAQPSCLSSPVKFSASGGVPPYSWSANGGDVFPTGTNTSWTDTNCVSLGRTVRVTVTDSKGASRQATITLAPNTPF